jgi:hypothetical protein
VGLFFKRDQSRLGYTPLLVPFQGPKKHQHKGGEYQALYHEYMEAELLSGPLVARGWVLQERLLSPRSIYFGKILKWECAELAASEVFPEGNPDGTVPSVGQLPDLWTFNKPLRLINLLDEEIDQDLEYANGLRMDGRYRAWLCVVIGYRKCALTYSSDLLPAISGMARCFREVLQDDYFAGIWRKDMLRGLLWYIDKYWLESLKSTIQSEDTKAYLGMYPGALIL